MAQKNMKAVVLQEDKTVKVEERPIPSPGPNEILLKVVAIGQNPTDWKHAELLSKPGMTMGCDFVGQVVSAGSNVPFDSSSSSHATPTKEKDTVYPGQLRWGFVRGGYTSKKTGIQKGAFAEYVVSPWDVTGVVPSTISPEQAATIPIPFATAVQALYMRLKLPELPKKVEREDWILIWSGSTSVGQYAIQLAKLSGLKVITTASEKRWDLMKGLGADVTVDYKDPEVVKKLKEATGDKIGYALDCISEKGSLQQVEKAIQPSGGHVVTLLFDHSGLTRSEVKFEATLAYNVLGEPNSFGDSPEYEVGNDKNDFVTWCRLSYELFGSGKVKPLYYDVIGGLDDVQKGFELMKAGKNANKIVYKV